MTQPTFYEDIFDMFIGKILDHGFLSLPEEDIEEFCNKYLKIAIAKFSRSCRSDLTDRDDLLGQFNEGITVEEENILATLMVSEWLAPQVNSIMNIKQFISDSEFKAYSQANHLSKLIDLKKEAEDESERLITIYTYTLEGISELR